MYKVILVLILLSSQFCNSQNIEKRAALEDFDEFVGLLEKQSSYFQVSDYNFVNHFQRVRDDVAAHDSVSILYLAYEMEKIIAETVDRHASVKVEDFEEDDIAMFGRHLPFAVAPLHDKIVALVWDKPTRQFEYYSDEFPFVKSINSMPIVDFIELYAYRRKKSPDPAKLYDGSRDLRDVGELYFKQNELFHREIVVVLTNGKTETEVTLPLSDKKFKWRNIGHTRDLELIEAAYFDKSFDYNKLDKWLEDSIAYLRLPAMFSFGAFPGLESHLKSAMSKYVNAEALIIDIRGNGGGTREILSALSGYFISPVESPWVANVTHIRNDQQLDEDIESMSSRFLYSYYSDRFSDDDRRAIDSFNNEFNALVTVDPKKFSAPFYMVLRSNGTPLECPIYVLADESSFSAASVFASALKGLSNVKIVGTTTNGSSGRSRKFYLANSNIRIKLSTMLSFQRNGKTLDGNGTNPDMLIERSESHVLGKIDAQLDDLIKWINEN